MKAVELVAVKHFQSGIDLKTLTIPSKGKEPKSSGKMCHPSKGVVVTWGSLVSAVSQRVSVLMLSYPEGGQLRCCGGGPCNFSGLFSRVLKIRPVKFSKTAQELTM